MANGKTAYFKEFQIYHDTALNFYHALKECKKQEISRLVVEPGVYKITPEGCAQKVLNISNHGFNGPKRIGVLIDGMEDFEIDFSGATLLCDGIIQPLAITGSKNITVKNLRVKFTVLPMLQATVVVRGDGWVDAKPLEDGARVKLWGNKLLGECAENTWADMDLNIEFNGETGEIEAGTGDNTLGVRAGDVNFEYTGEGLLHVSGIKRCPPIGNVLVFYCSRRLSSNIFCEGSADLTFANIDMCDSYGMGILAELCKNITVDRFNTVREDGHFYTVCADATHFVNCEGLIKLENSTFVGQFDDALNAHGMYTRIAEKGDGWLLVKEMHFMATGIKIFRPGDRFAVLHPRTLIPYGEIILDDVEYINDTYAKLYVKDDLSNIKVGDDLENLTTSPDVIFRNNTVRDNRARGMLLATRGKVLVENNYFHTGGCAFFFESDGEYWFEAGATADVTIRSNTFDRCKYGDWGDAVIQFYPRREEEEGKYFHGKISITDNEFILGTNYVAQFDNIDTLTVKGNSFKAEEGNEPEMTIHHVRCEDVQEDIKRR